jgi:signal transduction histidine kinase
MAPRITGRRADLALALGLAVVALAETTTADLADRERLPAAALASAMTLPLALRRVAPVLVLAVAAGAGVAASVAIAPPSGDDPVAPALALLVAVYSAGAYSRGLAAAAAGVVAAGLAVGVVLGDPEPVTWDGAAFFLAVFLAPWVAGRAIRRRRLREAELEREAAELERLRAAAVAEERTRIARELHDVVAHAISVIVLQARGARYGDEREREDALGAIEENAAQALAEMRRLLELLRSDDDAVALAPQPSLAHLDALVSHVRAAGLPVDVRVEGEPRELPPGVDVSAYRIVQEALTNALRHAGPARAEVAVRYEHDAVEVEVADTGSAGGARAGAAGGHGLAGMQERVAVFGGSFEAGPRRSGGFAVRARLPS